MPLYLPVVLCCMGYREYNKEQSQPESCAHREGRGV